MPAPGQTSASGRWVTVSELAGYAYCPRSWWYDAHPPAEGRTVDSGRKTLDGVRYHARTLAADSRRASWARAAGVVIAAASSLLVLGSILGWWNG